MVALGVRPSLPKGMEGGCGKMGKVSQARLERRPPVPLFPGSLLCNKGVTSVPTLLPWSMSKVEAVGGREKVLE